MPLLTNHVIPRRQLNDEIIIVNDDLDEPFDFTRNMEDETLVWDDYEEAEYPQDEWDYFFGSDSDESDSEN